MQAIKLLVLSSFIIFSMSVLADYKTIPDYSRSYDPKRDPFVDGRDAIRNAQATQRRILIELGGNWCAWCKKLEQFISEHKVIETELHKNFVILKVNVSDENDNKKFLSAFPKTNGYPHFFVSRANGSVLYSKDTSELLESGRYSEQRFLAFIQRWRKHE